jgi:hypothetical protein
MAQDTDTQNGLLPHVHDVGGPAVAVLPALLRRAQAKVASTRPFPQLRVLRTYGVSPLAQPRLTSRYALRGRETSNFTYDISNREELIDFLSRALSAPRESIAGFVNEIDGDEELIRRLETRLRQRRDCNHRALFGRRIGWYAVARWQKPTLAIETGTADGLGTAVLARALQRNRQEGAGGELLSFDNAPGAGWLLDDGLKQEALLVPGDARQTLPERLEGRAVDLFVHDSLHSYDHEYFELSLARAHASPRQILISDNAHATTALADIASSTGLRFLFFKEDPIDHFYPGAGIGIVVEC